MRLLPLVVLLALAFLSGPLPAERARAGGRSEERPSAAVARRGGPMPDSVLAWIGSRREVSLAGFRAAWRRAAPPARPDSLTPEAARRFLGILTGREALAEAALADPPAWTAEDSARVAGLRDRLTLRVALDSALAAARERLRASGDTTADDRAAGLAARAEAVGRLEPRWDDETVGRVLAAFRALPRPTADSGVAGQLRMLGRLPELSAADTGRVLARTTLGEFHVGELLAWWARLDPLGRPRVEDAEELRELASNALFERVLRAAAARPGMAETQEVAGALERQRELIAVQHRVAREVLERVPRDEATLRREFAAHRDRHALPERVRVLRLVLDDRASATAMALSLRDEAAAESLLARAVRSGVRYDEELTAAGDPEWFAPARRAGPGAVLGPDSVAAGWQVVRVRAVLPARALTFEEAREAVERDWFAREGERLTEALLERCRSAVGVRVNERALALLTRP